MILIYNITLAIFDYVHNNSIPKKKSHNLTSFILNNTVVNRSSIYVPELYTEFNLLNNKKKL
jgi:hypothetical protein